MFNALYNFFAVIGWIAIIGIALLFIFG